MEPNYTLTFLQQEADKHIDHMCENKIFAKCEYLLDKNMGEVVKFTFQNEFDLMCVEELHLTGE